MQGKKDYQEQLFNSFQLSERVPHNNFNCKLKAELDESIEKPLYDEMHKRLQTEKAKRLKKQRSSTVEPVLGTLINFTGMRRVWTRGIKNANKFMIGAATAYNLKKWLKYNTKKVNVRVQQLVPPEQLLRKGVGDCFFYVIANLLFETQKLNHKISIS